MEPTAVQDHYPDDFARCHGCGRLNERGLRLRTFEDGEETVTRFTPRPEHTAVPGIVYGGLLASLVDCHGTGSASIAACRAEDRAVGSGPSPRFVTASLKVNYLRPTPLGPELEIRGRIREVKGRKVVVEVRLLAAGAECVTGEVIAVRPPEGFGTGSKGEPAGV